MASGNAITIATNNVTIRLQRLQDRRAGGGVGHAGTWHPGHWQTQCHGAPLQYPRVL
jgi:hypothetical protein